MLEEMRKRGIPTVVWLTPILPFINDTEENITSILNECVRVGVKGIVDFGMGLTEIFQRICMENGILSSPEDCFRFMSELPEKYPQMSIFDL